MLEPSYMQIMEKINEGHDTKVVTSRYSIIIATARRARQIIDTGNEEVSKGRKPITVAVDELYTGKMIITENKTNTK